MTREEQIRKAAYSRYCNDSSVTFGLQCNCFEDGAKWADKEFADKVKKVSIRYKYNPDVTFKEVKEMIYDALFMQFIEIMKRNGFIEIKETQEGDESTIFMYVNVLKNNFKKATEGQL